MTELKQYENGYSPSALQRKYSLSYEQGYELADEHRKLTEDRDVLKSFIVRHHPEMKGWIRKNFGRIKQ